jgi:hypothetical protein
MYSICFQWNIFEGFPTFIMTFISRKIENIKMASTQNIINSHYNQRHLDIWNLCNDMSQVTNSTTISASDIKTHSV